MLVCAHGQNILSEPPAALGLGDMTTQRQWHDIAVCSTSQQTTALSASCSLIPTALTALSSASEVLFQLSTAAHSLTDNGCELTGPTLVIRLERVSGNQMQLLNHRVVQATGATSSTTVSLIV